MTWKDRLARPVPDFYRGTGSAYSSSSIPFFPLNGTWRLRYDRNDVGLQQGWQRQPTSLESSDARDVTVPFAPQTAASGSPKPMHQDVEDIVWYGKRYNLEHLPGASDTVLLKFGAVDYEATVWIDGVQVAHHRGGHVPFEADITSIIGGKAKGFYIVVRVVDKLKDLTQPRGKQYWKAKSESIFYTPTSGIWQSVWIEYVPHSRITRATLRPDIDRGTLSIDAEFTGLRHLKRPALVAISKLGDLTVAIGQKLIHADSMEASITLCMALSGSYPPDELFESMTKPGSTVLPNQIAGDAWNEGIALWSPEHPILYDIDLQLVELGGNESSHAVIDFVQTYAGMRKVSIDNGQFKLNNRSYFQRLVLDQGYWPGTGMTAPDGDAFLKDILQMKELGFNGCRKHQKVEDPRFLYCADHLGFLVWSEMANAYEFSTGYMERFTQEWTEVIKRDISHPCIIAWVPVNESWAYTSLPTNGRQRDFLRAIYYLTKSLDPSRPCVDNDGWEHVVSDLLTIHDYSSGAVLKTTAASMQKLLERKAGRDVVLEGMEREYTGRQPVILSEFGGVAIDMGGTTHGEAGGSAAWGYHTVKSEEELLAQLKSLVDAIIDGGIIQGFCYTQLADVEQEVNGLLTADREFKLDPVKVREVIGRRSKFDP